jgi:CDP-diacylglycerol--glycerol-3-phosphate 3-phosphatidyltransferase
MGRINIPNSLTIARILMAPVLALAMWPDLNTALAVAVFSLGMASDVVDGHLARSRGLETKFGALMDPIADKLFVGTALVCLAATSRLAVWVVVVIFARDVIVTGLRFAARRQGVDVSANLLGKAKTVFQALVVLVLLLADPGGTAVLALVYAMAALTVLSGAVYAVRYLRGRRILVPRVGAAPSGSAVGARATLG